MSVDPVAHNRVAWDREVEQGNEWTRPISAETVARARAGDWSIVLIGHRPVDRSWFPADLAGSDVLCLASGGGQQGPTLAAAGARVTVLGGPLAAGFLLTAFEEAPRHADATAGGLPGYFATRAVKPSGSRESKPFAGTGNTVDNRN
ncbi:hypothetical protein BJ973_004099 [Actinoplanes tereljensis]|uniref:Uncharacterized protein n=1 Tax=Paractinoplanes tereljensis TaxID=571912 RepID=A0A919NSF2_9ACTN|nr:hypothetical protein [Actinoplanes tereljensis]GIF23488.1 hypothetical protein Ate02nite_62180 [Actinoplanes tereljensis]